MYNEIYKRKFLNTTKLFAQRLERLFEKISDIEEDMGMDLCDMDPYSYPKLILENNPNELRFHGLYELFLRFMDYRNYCEIHGWTTSGLADQWFGRYYEIDDIYEIFRKYNDESRDEDDFAASFDEPMLWVKLSKLYPEINHGNMYDIPSSISQNEVVTLYMIFICYGIDTDDIGGLKKDQFGFTGIDTIQLTYRDREIKLSRKTSKLVRKALMSKSVIDGRKKKKKIQTDYLMAFDDPEKFSNKIRLKLRSDKHKTEIQIPTIRTIHFNSLIRIIAEQEGFREIKDTDYLVKQFMILNGMELPETIGINTIGAATYREIQGTYNKIVEYYS